MSDDLAPSQQSILDATRSRAKFSGHSGALGAAGQKERSTDPDNCEYLRDPGQTIAISPGEKGFEKIFIGAVWDNIHTEEKGFFKSLLNKTKGKGVDLDLGCFYELSDGTRGAIQAFGKKFGAFDKPPYIQLLGDERTGEKEGVDETILINGAHWDKIKKILVYIYIYGGAANWQKINPRVFVDVPGEDDLVLTLKNSSNPLDVCAVGGLENTRGGIKLTNYTEYFPGHLEMDRAFGFGLDWGDGKKS